MTDMAVAIRPSDRQRRGSRGPAWPYGGGRTSDHRCVRQAALGVSHFIAAFATSRWSPSSAGPQLGRIWQVLTPLSNAAVYFLIFGVVLTPAGRPRTSSRT